MKKKPDVFVNLSKKNHMYLQNGEVVFKRITLPTLRNNLLAIVTERLTDVAADDDVLGPQLEELAKINPNFIVAPIILQQKTVDNIMLGAYCWTVETTPFNLFILSEKSFELYKKHGLSAVTLLEGNECFSISVEE